MCEALPRPAGSAVSVPGPVPRFRVPAPPAGLRCFPPAAGAVPSVPARSPPKRPAPSPRPVVYARPTPMTTKPRQPRTPTGPPGVLILVENLSVPKDRRVWLEARTLQEAGYRVSVICPADPGEPAREVRDGVALYRFRSRSHSGGVAGYLFEYGWAMLAASALSLRARRERGFRLLQGCNPPDTFFLVAWLHRLLGGVRYVFDQHDLAPEMYAVRFAGRNGAGGGGLAGRLLRWCERRSWRAADLVLATNETFRRRAIERGGKRPEDVIVVRNGPDLARFRPVPERPERREGRRHLVAYVGAMAPQDGVDLLVEAAAHVVRARGRDDVLFVLLGDGDQWEALRSQARALGIEQSVRFPGWIADDADLAAWLCTADLCVAPDPANGLNEHCTFIKVAEYLAMARPVVAFDLPETRATAGEAGLYATPNDPRELGDRILELLDDPPRRTAMGRSGAERVRLALSWEHGARAYLQAYERLTARLADGGRNRRSASPAAPAQPAGRSAGPTGGHGSSDGGAPRKAG